MQAVCGQYCAGAHSTRGLYLPRPCHKEILPRHTVRMGNESQNEAGHVSVTIAFWDSANAAGA